MTTLFADTEGRRALRAAVAATAHSYGDWRFAEDACAGRFPHELWESLAAGGFAGVNVAEHHGGPGGTLSDLAVVAEELAHAGCPLMTLVVSPGVCGPLLAKLGTAAQHERWLSGIGQGSLRMAFAMTEPDAGSNSHRIRTQAERAPAGWSLRGEKHFISGVDEAAAMLVVAKTCDGAGRPGSSGLSLFIVETDAPGVTFRPIPMHVHAAERQFIVTFDDVLLPSESLLGSAGAGLAALFDGLNPERIIAAATCVGIGAYCLEKAVSYARERRVWDVPIGAHQAIAHPLAEAHIALQSARLMLQHAAAVHDAGEPSGTVATIAKLTAADAAARALDVAVQTHGGNGLTEEYGLAHLWGLVRMYRIAPVSREMTLNHVATRALGLPKSY